MITTNNNSKSKDSTPDGNRRAGGFSASQMSPMVMNRKYKPFEETRFEAQIFATEEKSLMSNSRFPEGQLLIDHH